MVQCGHSSLSSLSGDPKMTPRLGGLIPRDKTIRQPSYSRNKILQTHRIEFTRGLELCLSVANCPMRIEFNISWSITTHTRLLHTFLDSTQGQPYVSTS